MRMKIIHAMRRAGRGIHMILAVQLPIAAANGIHTRAGSEPRPPGSIRTGMLP